MNKFIINTIRFGIIFILVLVLKKSLPPYYLGNPLYAKKVLFVKNKKADYNTVVFGSSRFYRQINPVLLDSLLKEKKVNSFNFATPATFNPESYFLYKNFIKNTSPNKVKYAFLEVQTLNRLTPENAKSTKGSYWNSFSFLNYSNKYINQAYFSKNADKKRKDLRRNYLNSFFYSYSNFNILYNLNSINSNATFGKRKGYYPLEAALVNSKQNFLNKRHQIFLSDTTKLTQRAKASKNSHTHKNKTINEAHLNMLNDLITDSRKKGIHLFLVIPPRLVHHEYIEIIPMLKELPAKNQISLYDYNTYKNLYLVDNSFDIGHLNTKGSNILTTNLANEVLTLLNNN